jgi:hypothetical protein
MPYFRVEMRRDRTITEIANLEVLAADADAARVVAEAFEDNMEVEWTEDTATDGCTSFEAIPITQGYQIQHAHVWTSNGQPDIEYCTQREANDTYCGVVRQPGVLA